LNAEDASVLQSFATGDKMARSLRKSNLANTDDEWRTMFSAPRSPFVRTLSDWDQFVRTAQFKNSPLSKLNQRALKNFRKHLQFVEIALNGKPLKRCCIGWYYGDLMKKHNFSGEDVLTIAAHFGIGPQRFARTADKFGDICDEEVCCRPRPNFNCPDGKPDCSC
jgi:hypothetical protein